MVFMKSLTTEQYGAGIGDDFDAQLEYMKYQMILMNSWDVEQYGGSVGDDF